LDEEEGDLVRDGGGERAMTEVESSWKPVVFIAKANAQADTGCNGVGSAGR
jgi:hypothetical protein